MSQALALEPEGLWASRHILELAERIESGSLLLTFPSGESHALSGHRPGPAAILNLVRPEAALALRQGGALGFAESYLNGDWTSPDLATLFELVLDNEIFLRPALATPALQRLFGRLGRRPLFSPPRSLAFFASWLDARLNFAVGHFEGAPDETLESAARRRLQALATQAGETVLEVNCGWGSLTRQLAAAPTGNDTKLTSLAPDPERFEAVAGLLEKDGHADAVDLRLGAPDSLTGSFASIFVQGALEVRTEKEGAALLHTLTARLAPKGRLLLESLTRTARRPSGSRSGDFIRTHLYPGAHLFTRAQLDEQLKAVGLKVTAAENTTRDAARTLALWRQRLDAVSPDLERTHLADKAQTRAWALSLAMLEAGLRAGALESWQLTATR